MKSILENIVYTHEVKKSEFVTLLFKISSLDDVDKYLIDTRKNYPDATHYCYAYSVNGLEKFSDDGEPGGTAGLPIMEMLHQHNLTNVLCIVVRYFGGIKLGAGGLVRAYRKAANGAIKNSILIELVNGYLVEITVDYEEQKQLDYLLRDKKVTKQYSDKVLYEVEIEKDFITNIINYSYQIKNDIIIEVKI